VFIGAPSHGPAESTGRAVALDTDGGRRRTARGDVAASAALRAPGEPLAAPTAAFTALKIGFGQHRVLERRAAAQRQQKQHEHDMAHCGEMVRGAGARKQLTSRSGYVSPAAVRRPSQP
jgi:hypothetical protein